MKRSANYILMGLGFAAFYGPLRSHAATIWNGPTITVVNLPGSDSTQPANQDRMTSGVWITRGSTQGYYHELA